VKGVLRDLAGRDHHPEGARRLELFLELFERVGRPRFDVGVVRVHVVPVFAQALCHARTHAAEPDHPQLH